jgi:Flp pilus assembly pilin Flp
MEIRNLIRSKCSTKKSCDEFGGSLVEYGLLVALVALIAIPSVGGLSRGLEVTFQTTNNALGAGALPTLAQD